MAKFRLSFTNRWLRLAFVLAVVALAFAGALISCPNATSEPCLKNRNRARPTASAKPVNPVGLPNARTWTPY